MKQFRLVGLFALFLLATSFVSATPKREVSAQEVSDTRACIISYFESQTDVRETKNLNDGAAIDGYFAYIGLEHLNKPKVSYTSRYWCGAFMANGWLRCMEKVPFVKTNTRLASVDGWRYDGKLALIDKTKAEKADVVSYRAFRHVEAVYDRHPNPTFPYFTAVAGNTTAPKEAKDKRQGVHIKTRLWRDIAQVISVRKTLEMS